MTDTDPPPTGRRRAILGTSLVLAIVVLLSAAGQLWAWLASGSPVPVGFFGMLLGAVAGLVLISISTEAVSPSRRLHGPDGRWWTARTSTGMRTIDLHQLGTISYWGIHNRRTDSSRRRLVLTDTRGARLTVDAADPKVLGILQESLPHAMRVRISPKAAELLGVEPTVRGWPDRAGTTICLGGLVSIASSVGTYALIH